MYPLEGEHALEVSQPELFMQKKWRFMQDGWLWPTEYSSATILGALAPIGRLGVKVTFYPAILRSAQKWLFGMCLRREKTMKVRETALHTGSAICRRPPRRRGGRHTRYPE
jgi:hypothetical protein